MEIDGVYTSVRVVTRILYAYPARTRHALVTLRVTVRVGGAGALSLGWR